MIYIYALACPVTGRVRYIGKCKNQELRLRAHISKARSGHTAHHCARWINTLLSQGLKPVLRVLISLPNHADWQIAERQTIARYRRHGFDLTNLTGGGDGFHKQSPEMVRRRVASRKAWFTVPENRARFSAALRAAKASPEFRKKLSKIITASWLNPETRSRLLAGARRPEVLLRRSQISKKMHEDPEFSRKHSERLIAIWSTPERKEFARQRAIKLHSDPEIVERRKASLRSAHQNPELKLRMKEIGIEIGSRPEVIKIKSEKTKKSWADPQASAKRREALSSKEYRAKVSESVRNNWRDPIKGKRLRDIHASPESRAKKAEAAKRRATPEYRAMMAAKTKAAWASGKRKKKAPNVEESG